jgi:hypothetical protein
VFRVAGFATSAASAPSSPIGQGMTGRYAMDIAKIPARVVWEPGENCDRGLHKTVT